MEIIKNQLINNISYIVFFFWSKLHTVLIGVD